MNVSVFFLYIGIKNNTLYVSDSLSLMERAYVQVIHL